MQTFLNEVRNSFSNELERIHLLTRQDIVNVAKSYSLKKDYMHHINDAISVDMWVKKVSGPDSPAIYYKPQGESSEDIPLEKDDFLLVLMNSAQIIDDKCEGFPVCFIISNKQDHVVFQYALTKIKERGLNIEVKVFMSDIDNSFYNAWIKTFKTPEFRLWCIWHVDQAWRKTLKLIKNREKKVSVYQELCSILQETDVLAFQRMLEEFILQLQHAGELELANYFNKYYFDHCEKWAYCYHKGLGITQYKYVLGKIIQNYPLLKGKVSSKQAILRNRHNISKIMELDVFEEDDICG
ncbi:uncharacterized protein TNCV_1410951 [Trichonephila clavipes]|nr:uncharacterized protein TNCV_1410951 [Trichonephila clavipes]